jgi:hypothetical protein
MAALQRLPGLRALTVTGSATLHRLPRSVTALTALTSLEVGATMRDRGEDGPLPQDFAPLGRGGEGDGQGLLRSPGLRRLVVRDFQGRLHLPDGMERFTALEVRAARAGAAGAGAGAGLAASDIRGQPPQHADTAAHAPARRSVALAGALLSVVALLYSNTASLGPHTWDAQLIGMRRPSHSDSIPEAIQRLYPR